MFYSGESRRILLSIRNYERLQNNVCWNISKALRNAIRGLNLLEHISIWMRLLRICTLIISQLLKVIR